MFPRAVNSTPRIQTTALFYGVFQIVTLPELDMTARVNRLMEPTWGRNAVISAETVLIELVRFGEQPYAPSLSHAPDHLFNLVCFATSALVGVRCMERAGRMWCLLSRRWSKGGGVPQETCVDGGSFANEVRDVDRGIDEGIRADSCESSWRRRFRWIQRAAPAHQLVVPVYKLLALY